MARDRHIVVIVILIVICIFIASVNIYGWHRTTMSDISDTTGMTGITPSLRATVADAVPKMSPLLAAALLARLRSELQEPECPSFAPRVREVQEIVRLRELHDVFIQHPDRWDVLVALGDVYRSGAYPRFRPSTHVAEQCYKLAAMCPDGEVAGMAQSKFMQCREDPVAAEDIATGSGVRDLPAHFAQAVCAVGTDRIMRMPAGSFQKPHQGKTMKTKAEKKRQIGGGSATGGGQATTVPNTVPAVREFKADAQNVHDHGVTRAASVSIARLRAVTQAPKLQLRGQALVDTVAASLAGREDMSLDERLDAVRTLDMLNAKLHSTLDISEQDTLALVWDRISSHADAEVRDNLVCTLGKQLATAVEHGAVVCSSGRITRILGALEGSDDDAVQAARPMWAVRQELAILAGKVREDVLQAADPYEREMYEAGTDNVVEARMEARMRDTYRTQVNDTYCRDLGMQAKILDPFVEENVAAF